MTEDCKAFGFLTWNVGNAPRDETEGKGSHRYGLRCPDILATLSGPLDVVMLQELRGCLSTDGKSDWTLADVVETLAKHLDMKYCLVGNSKDPTWLHRALFYGPRCKLVEEPAVTWYDYPGKKDRKFNLRSTCLLLGDDTPVRIYDCHVEVALEARLLFSRQLQTDMWSSVSSTPYWVFAMGDFNTLQQDRGEQDAVMAEGWVDLSGDLKQTFLGFPYDLNPSTGEPWTGQLDHVYMSTAQRHHITVHDMTVQDLSKKQLSDHWPLYFRWSMKKISAKSWDPKSFLRRIRRNQRWGAINKK